VEHVACGPLSNGSSLPDAQRMVANLREFGHTVDIDDRALALVADYFRGLAAAEGLPSGQPQDFDAAFYRHQVAGGVMSTTRRQLRELGLEDRFDAVMHEVPQVRAELGYPIVVTPFAQMLCTQAMYNVIGSERYENAPDQVIRYVLGKFGRATAPIDDNVKERILSLPRAREIAKEPPPAPPEETRKRFRAGISDEEFLLRAVMPEEMVDAMLAKGPARRHYNPAARPLIRLVEGLAARPAARELSIEKGDLRVSLKAAAGKTAADA
jgi:oxaloacetate decarboxylase alpha subunit